MNKYIYLIAVAICMYSCDKREFLDSKPDQSDVAPRTLSDYRAILDQDRDINGMGAIGRGPVPGLGEIGADNYYIPEANFSTLRTQYQNYYRWDKEVYLDFPVFGWNWPYLAVFYANVVVEGLEKGDFDRNSAMYKQLIGEALFIRAHAFYQMAQVFVPPLDAENADDPFGLPLRLSADINEKLARSTIRETYARIEADLMVARNLLHTEPLVKTRPSLQAVYGMLARFYLTTQMYEKALVYADSCLSIQSELLDYGRINAESRFPFSEVPDNPEIIYSCNMAINYEYPISAQFARIDTLLYASYDAGDLRKEVYFSLAEDGSTYKGSYSGGTPHFAGIATDEMYLIKAECLARKDDTDGALEVLNNLLKFRYRPNEFPSIALESASEALSVILQERRKELIFRGHRWTDLRRLNAEGFEITLKRKLNGEEYTLTPQDKRYTWPIPDEVIMFYPEMPQNPR